MIRKPWWKITGENQCEKNRGEKDLVGKTFRAENTGVEKT